MQLGHHTNHGQRQNNLLTMTDREAETYKGAGERATGGEDSARDLRTPTTISADCPDHELPNRQDNTDRRGS